MIPLTRYAMRGNEPPLEVALTALGRKPEGYDKLTSMAVNAVAPSSLSQRRRGVALQSRRRITTRRRKVSWTMEPRFVLNTGVEFEPRNPAENLIFRLVSLLTPVMFTATARAANTPAVPRLTAEMISRTNLQP